MFIGYPRSSHSLIGSLLDAHPNIIITHELDALSYVSKDYSRDQIFQLILKNSQDFTNDDRKWTGYSYAVPSQWHGKFSEFKVIGDKKGGQSVWRLHSDLGILNKLKNNIGVDVKLIHVVRSPFDSITTIYKKESEKGLDYAIHFYFTMVDTVAKLKEGIYGMELNEVSLESFISDPKEQMSRLCIFLRVSPSQEYLEDCKSIVFSSLHKTRHNINWIPNKIKTVQETIDKYQFLSGYCFNN